MRSSPPRAHMSPSKSHEHQVFTDIKSSCGEQVDSRKATAPMPVFGSGTRPHTTNGSKAPGPGTYQIPSSIGKPVLSTMAQAPSCSISGREKFGSTADLTTSARLPGPGDYNSDIVNPRERAAPSYSLGKKWSSTDGDERIPGPGAYEASTTIGRTVLSTQKSNPVSSFPKVERKPLHASGTADVGPGQYSVVVESVGRQTVSTVPSGASYSFGTETRSKSVRSTGKYKYYDPKSSVGTQVESTYRTAPKCSMSGRPQTSNMSPPRPLGSPVNQTFTDVKSSCGGQVDSRKATAPGAVFGSGTRPHTTNGSKAPGPGTYQIPSTIGKAPSCSISGREKFGSTADLTTSARLPGPGDYNSDIVNPRERAAPSYSLGKKWSSTDGDERIPGPGAYEASTTIGRTVLSTQKSNPVSSFPKVERKPLHASGTADVGPGQYSVVVESVGRQTVSTVPSGASYSFGTETRSKSVRSTGKYKYYDPKSSVGTQVESTYRTAPKCSMSGRPQTSNMSPPRPLGSPVNQTFTDVKSSCGGQVDSRKATAPGAVFGSGTRPHTTNGSKAPGPGTYQIPSTIGKAPSCSISGREKFGSTADLTTSARLPGPGDYNSDIVNPRERAAPSYSLGKKWSSTDGDERIPGPGAYEASTTIGRTVLSTQKSNPVSSFPKVERKPLHASGTADVGPGQYSVVVESVGRQTVSTVPSGASYSFGTETRSKSVRSTGKYKYYDPKSSVGTQVESTYRTAPKCSMSGRPQTSNMSPPRPLGSPVNQTFTDVKSSCGGQVDSRKATAPGAVFGSGTRPHTTNGSKAPGPGTYQIPSTIGKAPSCSISGREKFGSTADLTTSARLPGPGDYNSDIVNPRERAAPSYSLGKKWSSTDGDERIPGPGAYEASTTIGRTVLSTQKSNPVSSFPKVERKPLHASGTADVGPGQYSVVVESVGRQTVSTVPSGASYSFGTETRSKSVRSTEKYKYYDPKSSVGTQVESTYRTAPKCSMSGRPQTSNMSPPRPLGSPVNQTFTDVKSSCGGQVDSRKATAPGAVFGSGTRPHTTNGSKAPGPGTYQIPSTIGKAPSCSISGREKFGSTADLTTSARLPGPGDYNSDIVNPRERAAPSYSLGKKWSSTDGDERIPGPGAYEASTTIGRTVLSTQKSNPVSSFPKVERKPLHASGTADVGPGQYSVVVESVGRQTVSTVPSGASYSFGTETRSKSVRSTEKYKYYDPKSSVGTQVESTYRTAPKCSMSGRPQTSNMSPPRPLGSPVNQTFTDVKSSCGGQVDSRKATAPGAVFGSGTRPHTTNGSKAPGPGTYQIPSTIGKAPSCSISGREKFGSTADLTTSARLPGPGDYNSDIVNPRERAAPSYSLGKKWSSTDGDERIPGPGAYEASTTIGRTVLSTQKSNPVSSFPKVERKPLHASGTADVGPGQYSVVVESVGRQTVSTVPSGASYSFGTDTRSKSVRSTGKYKYYDPKSSVGTQVESLYRTAPKCTISGRTKFGGHF